MCLPPAQFLVMDATTAPQTLDCVFLSYTCLFLRSFDKQLSAILVPFTVPLHILSYLQ